MVIAAAYPVALMTLQVESPSSMSWGSTDFGALEEVQLLREYLAIDTTTDQGSELAGAQWLAARLAEVGVEATIEPVDERHANLWARIEGDDPRALILHHHIDTESIGDPADWTYDPFEAHIDGPWVHGRGSYDMKSVGIAQLVAVRSLLESGRRPKRSVLVLATSSEETGSDLGTRQLVRLHPELFENAWAMLTEGGFVEPKSLEEVKYWAIEVGQAQAIDVIVCHQDRARLEALTVELDAVPQSQQPRLIPLVREYLRIYGPTRDDPALRDLLADPDRLVSEPERFQRLPAILRSLFLEERAIWPIEEAVGGGYQMRVAIHLLPGADVGEAVERLVPMRLLQGVAKSIEIGPPSLPSPLDHPVYLAIREVLGERRSGEVAGPAFLPWTMTDSRFVRELGIPSYGFSPFVLFASDTFTMSLPDERIGLPGFVEGVAAYVDLVEQIAGDGGQ